MVKVATSKNKHTDNWKENINEATTLLAQNKGEFPLGSLNKDMYGWLFCQQANVNAFNEHDHTGRVAKWNLKLKALKSYNIHLLVPFVSALGQIQDQLMNQRESSHPAHGSGHGMSGGHHSGWSSSGRSSSTHPHCQFCSFGDSQHYSSLISWVGV
jgi:hypothetical protein